MAGVQDALQALGVIGGLDLGGVAGAYGVDPVGKDAARLEVVGAAVQLDELRRVVAGVDIEHILHEAEIEAALKGDVVDGQQVLDPVLDAAAVLGVGQHREHGGVPVVAVDHVRLKVQLRQRLQHGAGEIGVLLPFHVPAEVDFSAEVVLVVHEVDGHAVHVQALDAHIGVAPAEPDAEIHHMLGHFVVFFLDAAVVGRDDARVHPELSERLRQRTSASPPVLESGAHSAAASRTFGISESPCAPSRALRSSIIL